VVISDFAKLDETDHVTVLSIAILFIWLKFIYFGRIFRTAWLVRMVSQVVIDIIPFMCIFILAVFSFGNSFFILARNGDERFTGDHFWDALIYSYKAGQGDFDTDNFDFRDEILAYIIWIFATLLVMLILLNLLIAIISDTFEKVMENIENNLLKEIVQIMVENEYLISRKRLFKNVKYLIVISEEKAESGKMSFKGKLEYLKVFMEKERTKQSKALETIEHELKEYCK
jgi:transient receptor potential cation channel subfamily V protein 6